MKVLLIAAVVAVVGVLAYMLFHKDNKHEVKPLPKPTPKPEVKPTPKPEVKPTPDPKGNAYGLDKEHDPQGKALGHDKEKEEHGHKG